MKRRVFVWIFICSLMLSSQYTYIQGEEEPEPFFTIDFLVPSTSWRRPWPALIAEELPKIGIGVDTYDETGWSQISPRTWGYPGPYPIPTYDDGGYDILFVGWSWGIFWDPSGLFESPSITPSGDNFYQYYNPKMDFAIANYTSSYLKDDLIYWIKEIQQMLYNDLPQIEIIYPASVYPYDENFSGWDGLLWAAEQQPIIDWKILGQNSFTYATPAGFDDFHPHQYGSIYDAQWLKQIFNGLLKQTPEQKNFFDNWITESYNTTNGLDFQIKLKDSAVWADGVPITTDDIIYNYQIISDPNYASSFYYHDESDYWDNTSITKINDKEFIFSFKQFNFINIDTLTIPLIPKHIWETIEPENHQSMANNWSVNFPEKMFGFGPYRLQAYDSINEVINLTKNENFTNWYGKEPFFDTIIFDFYSNKEAAIDALSIGNIDMIDSQFSPYLDELNRTGISYELVKDPGTQEMAINMNHPILGTGEGCPIASSESARHVRHAISHMIDRKYIVNEILNGIGYPGVTACPNTAFGYDESLKPVQYSITSALAHLKAAGYDITIFENNSTVLVGIGFPVIVSLFSFCLILVKNYCNHKEKKRNIKKYNSS